jgi:hypothetical protein
MKIYKYNYCVSGHYFYSFYVGTIQRICLFSDDFYSDSSLTLTTIAVKQHKDIGARPHVYGAF